MPKNSRRVHSEQRLRISKVAEVPARYAYDWLTDYRSDDGKLIGSKARYKVVRLAPERIVRIRISKGKAGAPRIAVDLIRLSPPNSWHTDQIDEIDLATVDYSVRPLGPKRTRVVVDILERWMTPGFPKAADYRARTDEYWGKLVAALEDRYRSGKPAVN